jgi:hypothetical protein
MRGAKRVDPGDRLFEHRDPMGGDVRTRIGVTEALGEVRDQAAHRRAQHHRIAMQQHEPGVGIHGGQRVERDGVVRTLERPTTAHAAVLQHLQYEPVVLVRGGVIVRQQPLAVRRDIGDRFPREAPEVLAHH